MRWVGLKQADDGHDDGTEKKNVSQSQKRLEKQKPKYGPGDGGEYKK